MQFIDLVAQQDRIKDKLNANIQKVLAHGQYILGPEVHELEEKLSAYTGAKYCITCANGTDALQIAQMAFGIGPGDEVITPGFTYIATAETVAVLGAKPIYVDINPKTYNLDADQLAVEQHRPGRPTRAGHTAQGLQADGQVGHTLDVGRGGRQGVNPLVPHHPQRTGATTGRQRPELQ